MRSPAPSAALVALLLLAAPASTRAGSDCHLEVGPRDRVAKGETLVIRAGARVENAIAFQGDLVVEGDAVVQKAIAIGGALTLRPGAEVKEDALAIGGDVRLEGNARVGKDAVSLGGQVRQSVGSRVGGSVVGLAVQAGGSSLARQILKGISAGDCDVVTKGATGG
jgi:UDP-3-O-[3-hydroxymyristoyl] glucosamine N-acyltransferase